MSRFAVSAVLLFCLGLLFAVARGGDAGEVPGVEAPDHEAHGPEFPIVELEPSRDTTLRAADPDFNDGTHRVLYAGSDRNGFAQRALLAVDPLEFIPAGSQILSVSLVIFVDGVASYDSLAVSLHRIRTPWAEGDSGGPTDGATWSHAFYDSVAWDVPGGDVLPFPSGGVLIQGVGYYEIDGGNLTADLQDMLDDPGSNHGWILVGTEASADTWIQLGSGDNSAPGSRPRWIVEFSPFVESTPTSFGRLKARTRGR